MTTVVVCHSALGLTEHVEQWAEALREVGHDVVVPDFYGGYVFDDLDRGVAFADGAGGPPHFAAIARELVPTDSGPYVYVGFSLGAAVAEILALEDERAVGAVMIHGGIDPAWVGCTIWPSRLSAQVHWSELDPWAEPDENAALIALAGGACADVRYDAAGHLFAFEGWAEYDSEQSHRLYEQVTDFLAQFD